MTLVKLIKIGDVKYSLYKAALITLSTITAGLIVESITKPAIAGGLYDSTPIETLSVDSRTNVAPIGQPKVYSSALESGVWYKIEALGEWTPDYRYSGYTLAELQQNPSLLLNDPWRVDARYVTEDSWNTYNDNDPKGYGNFGLYSTLLGSNSDSFWGSYQSNHTYSYEVLGSGQLVDFYVYDINFGDNFGSYKINVYRSVSQTVPEPSAVLGLGLLGLGAFLERKLVQAKKSNKADK